MQRLPIALFLCLAAPLAMGTQFKGAVYSPKPGIVCDKKAQFCADAQGLCLALTKEYLGDKAEQTVMNRIKEDVSPRHCIDTHRPASTVGVAAFALQRAFVFEAQPFRNAPASFVLQIGSTPDPARPEACKGKLRHAARGLGHEALSLEALPTPPTDLEDARFPAKPVQATVKNVLACVAAEAEHGKVGSQKPTRCATARELLRLLDRLILHSPEHRGRKATNVFQSLEQ